jgi:hypothetical protein
MGRMIGPTREDEVFQSTASAFQPCEHYGSRRLENFELDGTAGLALNDRRPLSYCISADHVINADTHQVAAAQFAIDRQIEQRPISEKALLLQPEADCPNFLLLQRPLRTDFASDIPCWLRTTVEL